MDVELQRRMYHQMVLIRSFEEKCAELYAGAKIGGFLHLYIGEEAVAVGAVNAFGPGDDIITHYRDHGHALARGLEPGPILAELCGRETGVCKGRGGSMHIADVKKRLWGGYAIVGGHLPLAVGLAHAQVYRQQSETAMGPSVNKPTPLATDKKGPRVLSESRIESKSASNKEGVGVVGCFFGDAATDIGEFHESMNFAALWSLPCVFICENNLYGMGVPIAMNTAVTEIVKKAAAYGTPAKRVDGMDVVAMHLATREAVAHCRAGNGPYFIEAMTYRFRGHSMADPELYRDKAEVELWKKKDPIVAFRKQLEKEKVFKKGEADHINAKALAEVEEAARFALESPFPAEETLNDFIYATPLGTP